MEAPALRWGVVGPGGIARAMAHAMATWTRQRVVAVASRSLERAKAFADEVGAEHAYDDVVALCDDPQVDVVYVATTHQAHRDVALAAVAAGKPVLVEKAFTLDAAQAREVAAAARAAGTLVVEAMWPRFGPRYDVVRQLLDGGALGDVRYLVADHSQRLTHVPRLMRPELAGGAMLDLGVYPVSFAHLVLGPPDLVQATGTLTVTGVDETVAAWSRHGDAYASLTSSLAGRGPCTAVVVGTDARIELGGTSFYAPGTVRLVATGQTVLESDPPIVTGSDALAFEAAHVARLVADGAAESPLMPLAETVAVMETLDAVRAQVGVCYPEESVAGSIGGTATPNRSHDPSVGSSGSASAS